MPSRSPRGKFAITYAIAEDEWQRAARDRWNPAIEPVFDSFYGRVEFRLDQSQLLGENGYEMSVADLACGIAEILRREIVLEGSNDVTVFRQSDDSLEVEFQRLHDQVRILPRLPGGCMGEVDVDEFLEGAREFVQSFAQEAVLRVPGALSWKDLASLRTYVDD